MAFSKNDIEAIKSKLQLSTEIEKKTKIVKKGKDYWCCCLFHEEKTPSCKINDELGSFYCFGCGAKGDIFTIYTDLYNYSFQDAVIDLANKAGIVLKEVDKNINKKSESIKDILIVSTNWFIENLKNPESKICREYLLSRNLKYITLYYP